MRLPFITLAIVWCALLIGCQNEKKACVEKSANTYRNTYDFVWESAQAELKDGWTIQSTNTKTHTLTTGWRTNLSPYASHGTRDRLVVTLCGDQQSGWKASAKQESQTNDNEENPLDAAKAKWTDAATDGSLASRFLQNLDMRLQPDERWRERLVR